MTLLEYLANPDSQVGWAKAKKQIACHVAASRQGYDRLLERFKELSGNKDANGNEHGYRTLIVHHGRYLEEILPTKNRRAELFRELQGYAGAVLEHMFQRTSLRWSEFLDFRKDLRRRIGVTPDHDN